MEIENDGRQQEHDERLQQEPLSAAEYWAKREQDMRDQRDFWRRWNDRWNVNTDWPFRRT